MPLRAADNPEMLRSLGGNDLGAEGAQHLAAALRGNSTLQHLM